MGRPPKPLKVHQIEGTWREDRHGIPSVASRTGDGLPAKPASLDAVATSLWEFVCTERKDWLSTSDGPALAALCEAWSLRAKALDILQADPTEKGTRIAFATYHTIAEKLLAKFGMTPTDRARMGEITTDEYDPAAEFIA